MSVRCPLPRLSFFDVPRPKGFFGILFSANALLMGSSCPLKVRSESAKGRVHFITHHTRARKLTKGLTPLLGWGNGPAVDHMPFASHKRPNLILNNTFKGQIIYDTVK
jgi:hypothetical protein